MLFRSLPLPPDVDVRNVAAQSQDAESVLSYYRRALRLRREMPALNSGAQEPVEPGDPDVVAYVRRTEGQAALILLNFASRPAAVRVPAAAAGGTWRVSLSTHPRGPDEALGGSATLAPLEALIAAQA